MEDQINETVVTVSNAGCGLDLGTMNLVSARQTGNGSQIETKRIRDVFIDLDIESKKTLRLSNVDYVERDGTLVVLGDPALNMANLFKREVRRPLCHGIISAGELDAQQILSLLIENVLGPPVTPNEHCFYSIPAEPVDDKTQDIIYHTEVFRKILTELGYTPHPMNEAMSIIYSQCVKENFSGLAASFGSGMMNIALSYQTVKGLDFALARCGDWVDIHAAKATDSTASRMCAIKEKGVDLANPKTREEEAIALYIRALIKYCLENIAVQFKKVRTSIDLPDPVPFIISGGTSKATGFMKVFTEEFEAIKKRDFPIEISEIRAARDPMTAVAEGLLVLAMEEHADVG